MNIAPINNVVSSLAGTHVAQSRGDTDRNSQEVSAQQRVGQLTAGTEQVQGDTGTEERDADGRLPYRRQKDSNRQEGTHAQNSIESTQSPAALATDPSGETGTQLDLVG